MSVTYDEDGLYAFEMQGKYGDVAINVFYGDSFIHEFLNADLDDPDLRVFTISRDDCIYMTSSDNEGYTSFEISFYYRIDIEKDIVKSAQKCLDELMKDILI